MTIEPFAVVHCGSTKEAGILDPIPAVGYRISREKETIVISGDTGDCPSLREIVRGADLAILEATYTEHEEVDKELLEKVHLSLDLALQIGHAAQRCILVHRRRKTGK